jgi:two-component system phosphate regulon response regulator PhoB
MPEPERRSDGKPDRDRHAAAHPGGANGAPRRSESRDSLRPFKPAQGPRGAFVPAGTRADRPADTEAPPAWHSRIVASPRPSVLLVMRDELMLLTRHILETEGYLTLLAAEADDARALIEQRHIDLVLFDMAAGIHDGLESLVHDLVGTMAAPKLVLLSSAHGRVLRSALLLRKPRSVEVLQHPLSPTQLIACVQALLRRTESDDRGSSLTFGDVDIDLQTYRIHRNRRRINVGPIEFRLLYHLLSNSPKVLSRQELIEAAWPRRVHVEPRTVDVHIGRLRRELNKRGEPNLIRTVRSAGYSFDSSS